MTVIEKLVANGNAILNFLKNFSSDVPQDVSVDWINENGSIDTKTFANIKKFQDSVGMVNDGGVVKDLDGFEIDLSRQTKKAGFQYFAKDQNSNGKLNLNYGYSHEGMFNNERNVFTFNTNEIIVNKAGVYSFHFTAIPYISTDNVYVYLKKNGTTMSDARSTGGASVHGTASGNVVLNLDAGDKIWIEASSSYPIHHGYYTGICGVEL
jgi:hypothetical protein